MTALLGMWDPLQSLRGAAIVALVVLVLLVGRRPVAGQARRRPAARFGRRWEGDQPARWATRRDLRGLVVRRPVPGRLVLGYAGRRLVAGDPAHSVLVVGPTQSMKTTAVAVPALLDWHGPVVAASVKADLARATIRWRSGAGTVWVYDPAGVVGPELWGLGARPVTWTPVDAAGTWVGARRVAAALVETARSGDAPMADGDFWYGSAAKLLAPLLHAAAASGAGIGEVVRWLDEQDEAEPAAALQRRGATAALQAARACWGRDPRQRSGLYATAESVLEAYVDLVAGGSAGLGVADAGTAWGDVAGGDVAGAGLAGGDVAGAGTAWGDVAGAGVAGGDVADAGVAGGGMVVGANEAGGAMATARWSGGAPFSPAALLDVSGTLYLCAPAHHQKRLRPLFAALLGEVVQAALDRAERQGTPLDPGLLVVVDEAANVAPVADLDVLAATAAGHGVQLVTVWQDLAQVSARYGARAATVVNNHRAKLFLSGIADPNTLEHASTLAGDRERWQRTSTVDAEGRASTADTPVRQRLLPPDALRRLPPGWGVLVCGHRQPCRLRLRPWFADPVLRRRARGGPGAPAGRR